jgi:hypothetical protein
MADPEIRKKISDAKKGVKQDPAVIERRAETLRLLAQQPGYKEARALVMKKAWETRRAKKALKQGTP